MNELLHRTAEALAARGFEVYLTGTKEQTRDKLLELVEPGQSVGIGGSMSVNELGIADALLERGHEVYWHGRPRPDYTPDELRELARKADVYLASSNAVTVDGRLVNIDGVGNRVAAMFQGPKTVFLVVGAQKIVEGGLDAAIARIRRVACPANAKRLNLPTPCGLTGKCNMRECGFEPCMCRVITMLEHPARGKRLVVLLSEEEFGY